MDENNGAFSFSSSLNSGFVEVGDGESDHVVITQKNKRLNCSRNSADG